MTIHRSNLNGLPQCGAAGGNIANYGVNVTCPECVDLEPVTKTVACHSCGAHFQSMRPLARQGHEGPIYFCGLACYDDYLRSKNAA